MVATTLGSYFVDFGATTVYPTDGAGSNGSGSLATASHLRDAAAWIVTGFVIQTIGAAERTWTLKDPSGTTIATWKIPTSAFPGQNIEVGYQLRIHQGFTIESDNADCTGTLAYQIVRYQPSTA